MVLPCLIVEKFSPPVTGDPHRDSGRILQWFSGTGVFVRGRGELGLVISLLVFTTCYYGKKSNTKNKNLYVNKKVIQYAILQTPNDNKFLF